MSYGYTRGAQQYQQVSTSGAAYADPHQQVQLLMDGALERIAQAKGAIGRAAIAEKGERLTKAIAIIAGLQASLDHPAGGEVAANLAQLYEYMQRRLLHANLQSDVAALDEVAGLLREIRGAWSSMPMEARGATAPPAGNGTIG